MVMAMGRSLPVGAPSSASRPGDQGEKLKGLGAEGYRRCSKRALTAATARWAGARATVSITPDPMIAPIRNWRLMTHLEAESESQPQS